MSQFDMVVTQWAFVGPALIFSKKLGMSHVPDEDFKALVHQLYLVGKALGVRDEYNLCTGTLEEVKAYCRAIHQMVNNLAKDLSIYFTHSGSNSPFLLWISAIA